LIGLFAAGQTLYQFFYSRYTSGTADKDDPADVAKTGFDAMMRGDGDVVSGMKNKVQSAIANVTPALILAKQHRKMAEPGTAGS